MALIRTFAIEPIIYLYSIYLIFEQFGDCKGRPARNSGRLRCPAEIFGFAGWDCALLAASVLGRDRSS